MTTVYLEGIMCSCHGTEHNITTDRETLLNVLDTLAPTQNEARRACHRCGYRRATSELDSLGWCKDTQSCENLYQWHQRQQRQREGATA